MTMVETAARPRRNAVPADAASATLPCSDGNDATVRHQVWRRFEGMSGPPTRRRLPATPAGRARGLEGVMNPPSPSPVLLQKESTFFLERKNQRTSANKILTPPA